MKEKPINENLSHKNIKKNIQSVSKMLVTLSRWITLEIRWAKWLPTFGSTVSSNQCFWLSISEMIQSSIELCKVDSIFRTSLQTLLRSIVRDFFNCYERYMFLQKIYVRVQPRHLANTILRRTIAHIKTHVTVTLWVAEIAKRFHDTKLELP